MDQTTPTLEDLFGAPITGTDAVAKAARIYLEVRKIKEEQEQHLKDCNESLRTAETALFQKMDEARTVSVKLDDGTLVSTSTSTKYNLPAGGLDNDDLKQWMIVAGGQDLLKTTIHHASFSSFCKELVEQGKQLPEAVKSITLRTVRVTRK
jgi:hypothetical protein